jgi:hypothetical protein
VENKHHPLHNKETRYFTGLPCLRGHIAERSKSSRACIVCAQENYRKYYQTNLLKYREKGRRFYFKNHEENKAKKREHMKLNKDHYNVLRNARKYNKRLCMPKWLNKEQRQQITEFYVEAKRLTKLTGIEFHVDHIYPINGKTSMGLHVPWNLQILTREDNIAKGNRL